MRVARAALFLLSGCSFVFAEGPPADHARRDDYACTSSYLVPGADVAWGALNGIWGTGRALVDPDSFGDVSQGQVIAITLGWAAVSAISAYTGFNRVRECRQAQQQTMARLGPGHERRYREGLLYSGIAVFGASYLGTLVATAAISEDSARSTSLYYVAFPIVGPLGLASSGVASEAHVPALLISTAVQATGAVLAFLGTKSRIVAVPTPGGAMVFLEE